MGLVWAGMAEDVKDKNFMVGTLMGRFDAMEAPRMEAGEQKTTLASGDDEDVLPEEAATGRRRRETDIGNGTTSKK